MTFIKKTFQKLIYLLGGLVAGLALLIIFAAWQFSYGPIPLGFLAPYIEAAVNHGTRNMSIRMGEPILTWAGWDRALDIRIMDLELVDEAGIKIGSIPEAAFSIILVFVLIVSIWGAGVFEGWGFEGAAYARSTPLIFLPVNLRVVGHFSLT